MAALPRRLAVAVVGFAGADQTRTVVGWQRVSDERGAAALADQIADAFPITWSECGGLTAVGEAIAWSLWELARNAYDGMAEIDVSGDGSNSQGEDLTAARDRAVATGVPINRLAIINEETRLAEYYQRKVIGGLGAFVLTAVDHTSLALAIRLKLLRELAPRPVAARGDG